MVEIFVKKILYLHTKKNNTNLKSMKMKNEYIDPKLKEFLIKEGVYDKFVANRKRATDIKLLPYWNNWDGTNINLAFPWLQSLEGPIFWVKISHKYENIRWLQS